ncbi:hypothetical protein SUGI_0152030 [Cryptomeria japonica]|nr:hypothetical protein SUGI_0152030 [Cryptomeria japonica]
MEMICPTSKSPGFTAQVFTGILSYHCDPPPEFCYNIKTTETTIQYDPFLYDYNVEEWVDLFVQLAEEQANNFVQIIECGVWCFSFELKRVFSRFSANALDRLSCIPSSHMVYESPDRLERK